MSKCSIENKETILSYFEVYNSIQSNIFDLREENPAANFIQTPKLSSAITESLAHYLITEHTLIPVLADCNLIGRGDLVYGRMCGIRKNLQIKSTGRQAFSKTSQKDLKADYLIWLDMSGVVAPPGNKRCFEAHVLKNPGAALPKPKHIRLKEFLELPEIKSQKFVIDAEFVRTVNHQSASTAL